VDDNRDGANSLAMLLGLTGNETKVVHDGLEAVDAAASWRPEVVLLEIGLPRLNGYDVCRPIRGEPWGRDMMLVALIGWVQDSDRRKSSAAGFDRHLAKPVAFGALSTLLSGEGRGGGRPGARGLHHHARAETAQ